jgi:hypothetical protein
MDRERGRRLISGLFGRSVDQVRTDELASMKSQLQAQKREAQVKGIYDKALDALDKEIEARKGDYEKISPQKPSETRVSGYPGDLPGEIRHGVRMSASAKWRVTGR